MARAARQSRHRGHRKAPAKGAPRRGPVPARARLRDDPWAQLALIVLGAVLAVRLGVNALEPFPVHFDEAQYWAYGQALDLGYFSKPPLVAWLVRGVTDALGDTLFALRLPSAVAHALIGWLIFLTGRRLWWLAVGALVGAGLLAKYTMIAFAIGALGYGLFSARARDWKGTGIAALTALVVVAPNLWWNWAQGFVTLRHVAEDADPGRGYLHPWEMARFLAEQLGVIGPVFFVAILIALWNRSFWRDDWGMRLVAWQTVPLLAAMTALALITRANGNWAAPAYVGGALVAARWLVQASGVPALRAQLGIGIAASLLLWTLAGLYKDQADALTRRLDPYRVTRLGEPFCGLALGVMAEEGVGVLLSDNRRRLSECMFHGGLGWGEVAIWNPDGRADNHHELITSLRPGDDRAMLLAVTGQGAGLAHHFAEAREIESGRLATHLDRWVPFSLWVVRGFRGYGER